jgi:hypothetical protein
MMDYSVLQEVQWDSQDPDFALSFEFDDPNAKEYFDHYGYVVSFSIITLLLKQSLGVSKCIFT